MSNIFTFWQFKPVTVLAVLALCVWYAWLHRFHWKKETKLFLIAFALLIVCLFSPLKILSSYYLFSAHMTVHVLLLLIIGPLIACSLPEPTMSSKSFISFLSHFLWQHPLVAWLTGVGVMWFWHIPFVFNSAMVYMHSPSVSGQLISLLENFSLVLSGMLFGWPLLSPVKKYRLPALKSVVYLFTACMGCSLLGVLITFAPAGLYHHFLAATDRFQLNNIILNQWQINQVKDQQIAGLIMWVPCCLIYVVYALSILARWFNEKETTGYLNSSHE